MLLGERLRGEGERKLWREDDAEAEIERGCGLAAQDGTCACEKVHVTIDDTEPSLKPRSCPRTCRVADRD